jgi:hypothetical protein
MALTFHDLAEAGAVELVIDGPVSRSELRALIEHLEQRIAEQGYVNVVEDVRRLGWISPSTFWDDLKFGFRHMRDFPRAAVVGQQWWVKAFMPLAHVIAPGCVRRYPREKMEAARAWVVERPEAA